MRYRLYLGSRPCGTFKVSENYGEVSVLFPQDSKLQEKYWKMLNGFLNKNKLKIIKGFSSIKTKHNYTKCIPNKYFETYRKFINPRTRKIEFHLIK